MHREVLTHKQTELLPLVRQFMDEFGLVGGTAIALQIGHRRSLDFDLFSNKEFSNRKVKNAIIRRGGQIERVFKDELDQLTLLVHGTQMTFFHYPFKIDFTKEFEGLRMPELITLAAMKSYAFGHRAKWKDYVDLYFIIKHHHRLSEIIKKSEQIFGGTFNERLFREQLSYFDDIDYSEEVEFMPGFEVSRELVQKELTKFSLE